MATRAIALNSASNRVPEALLNRPKTRTRRKASKSKSGLLSQTLLLLPLEAHLSLLCYNFGQI